MAVSKTDGGKTNLHVFSKELNAGLQSTVLNKFINIVIPANAGIQALQPLDARLRGHARVVLVNYSDGWPFMA